MNSSKLFSVFCGFEGFDKVVWDVVEHKQGENPSITFKYHSHDGEEDLSLSLTHTHPYTVNSSVATENRLPRRGFCNCNLQPYFKHNNAA